MNAKRTKLLIDLLLGIGLLLLMSCQVVGEAGHEWTGIGMTLLMAVHQILNRKWFTALFKGKYTPLRTVQTCINAALMICFILTALCGINMSVHAAPFLSEFMQVSLGRRLHLTLSHWCFVLMGLHLGLHVPAMLKGVKNRTGRRIGFGLSILAAGAGLWLFLRNNYPDYLFCRVSFAFIDYEKPAILVLAGSAADRFLLGVRRSAAAQIAEPKDRRKKQAACTDRHPAGGGDRPGPGLCFPGEKRGQPE